MKRLIELKHVEAQRLLDRLRSAEIKATASETGGDGTLGGSVIVWVPDDADVESLRRVLFEFLQDEARTRTETVCDKCGYDLRGHAREACCPECGDPFRPVPADVACSRCEAKVPSSFGTCWSCGAPLRIGDAEPG